MHEYGVLLWCIGALLTLTGLAGLLLPLVPGAPLLFMGLFCGAWAENFRYVGLGTLVLLAGMAALTYLVEFVAQALGAKHFGGSRRAMIGAAAGGLIGMLAGPPGIILGPFIGAVLGELSLQRTLDQASRAGFGTVVGLAVGVAGKFAIGIAMIGLFALQRLW
jgi:uncharacterized protein YqgC (DUF456 family)